MSVIDNRIVMMQFNNKDFEKNAKQTMSTLEKLKMALDFKAVRNTLQDVAGMSSKGFAVLTSGAKDATQQFNILEQAAIGALRRIGEQAASAGERLVKSLSIDQISSGFQKYETEVGSVQTIMNATGKSIEEVQKHLDKLMWFTDETSYSFSDMTSNIGKFTSAGVDLGEATEAMMGISNWAALAGQGTNEASRAMYNLSQAMSVGVVKLMDWRSIENANMATTEFKQSVIDSAVALGTLRKEGKGLYKTMNDNEVTVTNFNEALSDGWFTSGVLLKTLRQYNEYTEEVYRVANEEGVSASEAMEIIGDGFKGSGEKAFKAAQEAKTFTDAINSVKDAVSTGWLKTFDLVFGNYVEAKWMWTELANLLWDTFASGGEYRNEQLDIWRNDFDGRRKLVESFLRLVETFNYRLEHFKETIHDVFGSPWDAENLAAFSDRLEKFTDDVVNTQHLTDRFNQAITPFLKGVKVLAVGIGRVIGTVMTYTGAFLNGFFRNDIFSAKTEYGINSIAMAVIRFANTLSTSEDTLATFSTIGSHLSTIFVDLIAALKDIFSVGGRSFADVFGSVNVLSTIRKVLRWISDRVIVITQAFREGNRGARIVKGIWSALRLVGTVIGAIGKAVLPLVDKLIDFALPYILEGLAMLGDVLSGIDYDLLFNEINTSTNNLIDTIAHAKDVIADLSDKAIKKAWDWITKVKTVVDKLLDKLSGRNGISKLQKSVTNLSDTIKKLFGKNIERQTETAGESIMSLADRAADTGDKVGSVVDTLDGAIDVAADVIDRMVSSLADLIDSIPKAIEFVSNFFNAFQNGSDDADGNETIFDRISNAIQNMFSNFDAEALMANAANWAGTVFTGFIQGLQQIDWEKLKGLSLFIGLIITLIKLNTLLTTFDKTFTNIKKIPGGISDFISTLTGTVKGVKTLMTDISDAVKSSVKVQQITALAAALSSIVLALALMSQIPEQDMARAIVYLGIIAVILKLLNKDSKMMGVSINKMQDVQQGSNIGVVNGAFSSKESGIALLVIGLTGFVLAITKAVKDLGSLDTETLVKGFGALVVALGMIALIIGVVAMMQNTLASESKALVQVGKFQHAEQSSSFLPKGLVPFLFGVVVSAKILAGVMASIGNLSPDAYSQGLLGLVGIMSALLLFMVGMADLSRQIESDRVGKGTDVGKAMLMMSTSMIILAIGVTAMVPAIAMLGGLGKLGGGGMSPLWEGILAMAAIITIGMGVMSTITRVSTQYKVDPSSFLIVASSFVIFAAAMDIIVPAIAALSALGVAGALWDGLGAFAIIVLTMGTALGALTAVGSKMGDPNAIIKVSAAFVIFSAAMIVASIALERLTNIKDIDTAVVNFMKAMAVLAGGVLVLSGIAFLLSQIPGAFLILEGIAYILAATAAVFIAFGASMWIIGKAMPMISDNMPAFVASLVMLVEFMEEHAAIVAGIFTGILIISAVLAFALWAITSHLGGFFKAIESLLGGAKKKFGELPEKSQTFIKRLVVGLVAGLAVATPEVIDKIGEIVVKIMRHLGMLMPPIIDGLLQLIIAVIYGLADAIRSNSGALIVAITDVAEALLEVIMDGFFALFKGLSGLSEMLIESMRSAGGIWSIVADALDFLDPTDTLLENAELGFDDTKKFLRQGVSDLATEFGVDTEKYGKDMSDSATESIKSITDKAKEEAGLGLDSLFGVVKDKAGGATQIDLAGMLFKTDSSGGQALDVSNYLGALGDLQNGTMQLDDASTAAFTNIGLENGILTEDMLANSDIMSVDMSQFGDFISDETTDTWGNYTDTVSSGSEDAREAVEGDIDGTLSYMRNKETSFYQAGVNMMQGLQNGLDYQFQFVKGSIVAKANQLINVFEREQQIESPSKVWMGLGGYMMLGLANGIEAQSSAAVSAVSYVASAVNAALEDDTAYQPTIRPVVDMSMVSGAAGTVRGFFAGQSVQLAGINGRLDMQAADLRAQMDQNKIYNDANVVASIGGLRDDVNALNGAMSNMQVVMDTGAVVGATAPKMDQALYQRAVFKGRRN